jgi:DNA-binding winged helix-turn-helix (wHTH) protein/TolB-like protein
MGAPLAVLADSAEYRVGRFTLRPHRQLLDGGVPVAIGRKALDVLSVLAGAEGALVTKDELMAAVWPNAIVEDNAIQVHVAALRKVLGSDAGLLTTAHGLGYRLAAAAEASPTVAGPGAPHATNQVSPQRRIAPLLSAGLSVVAIAAATLWPMRDRLPWASPPADARVAVLPFDGVGPGLDARALADGLPDEIVSALSDGQVQAVSRTESQALRGADAGRTIERLGVGMLLDGTVQSDGKSLDVRVRLDDAREHVTIWSDEFRGPVSAPQALQANVAAHAADVAYWAKVGRSGKVKLDAASLAAFIAGRENTTDVRAGGDTAAMSDYQRVVAASPDFSWGHSSVAVSDAFQLIGQPPNREALRADARREAARALALDPHNGEAYVALELAAPTLDWAGREALLLKGVGADPSFEPGSLMEGRLLWATGRGGDALRWLRSAHEIDPLHNGETWSLALILASEGQPAASQSLVARMETQWPEHGATRDARFWTSVVSGQTDRALALAADPAARPYEMNQAAAGAWSAALKTVGSQDRTARASAASLVKATADAGSLGRGEALMLLTMLGDLDGAFAQARLYDPDNPYAPPYLFLPPTAPMRSDPRFMALARKLGLVDYWQAAQQWPDFCRGQLDACKVRAAPPASGGSTQAPRGVG